MEHEDTLDKLQVGDKLYKYIYGNVFKASYIEEYEVTKVNQKTYRIKNTETGEDELVRKNRVENHGYKRFNQAKYDSIQKEKLIGIIKNMGYNIRYDEKISGALYNMKLDEVVRYHNELRDLMNRVLRKEEEKRI